MKKIITFGSATQDIFLALKKGEKFLAGTKVGVENLEEHTGGGFANDHDIRELSSLQNKNVDAD